MMTDEQRRNLKTDLYALLEFVKETDDIDGEVESILNEIAYHFTQAISQAKEEERKRVVQEIIDNNGFVAVGSKDGREVEYELVKEYL